MEERKCQICGSQIAIIRVSPELYFYINENGEVEKDMNPDVWGYPTNYEYQAICTKDKTHDIWPLLGTPEHEDLSNWCDDFINACKKLVKNKGL